MKKACKNPSCQRLFIISRFNRHHHDYCDRPDCVRYRDRIRKRRSRKRHPPDAEFRAQEVVRVQEYRKRKKKMAVDVDVCQLKSFPVASQLLSSKFLKLVEEQNLILAGLAVQLGGFSDSESVADFLGRCRKRGQELCLTGNDPPC